MAIEHLLAAVDIERRVTVFVQRTESRDLFASVVASWFPPALFEKLQQRNPRREDVVREIHHGGARSTVSMRAAARKSQAKRVGEQKNRRLSMRRQNQRRMVEASAMRSGSQQSGADCSRVSPLARWAKACSRAD